MKSILKWFKNFNKTDTLRLKYAIVLKKWWRNVWHISRGMINTWPYNHGEHEFTLIWSNKFIHYLLAWIKIVLMFSVVELSSAEQIMHLGVQQDITNLKFRFIKISLIQRHGDALRATTRRICVAFRTPRLARAILNA